MKWNWEFGPATIAVLVGMIVQGLVVIWAASSTYYGITHKIENQGEKLDRVATGSKERFGTVATALEKYQIEQKNQSERVAKVETSLGFVSQVVQQIESRLDGSKK